ncbi:hypothetical protein [Mucilaginibacter kameinonensis]|uniref:hypothetical protein n=1 Tax=Mucilaginibacter kameinonensis TaxID=452286 RepID=UPI0013CED927|nr:hypothetical protein [Mucilaginibacter kameinonensis]
MRKGEKRLLKSFVELENNSHLCSPQTRREERLSGAKTKRKKSFGKEKKVVTFAAPSGTEV